VWGRMDDTFADHPKVEELSLDAIGLWTLCWSRALRYSATADVQLGFVSETQAKKRAGHRYRRLVAELTTPAPGYKHGMWEPVEGGFLIHDFEDYLPRRRDPAEAAESGRKGARKRWHKHDTATPPDSNSDSSSHSSNNGNSDSSSHSSALATDSSRAYVARVPVPYRPVPEEQLTLGEHRSVTSPPAGATQHPPDDDPTQARCTAHTGHPDPPPCRGCQTARERAQTALDRDRDQAERAHRLAAEQAALACTRCDGTWIVDPATTLPTRHRCDHRRAS
jgi:hypothetical protein